MHYPSPFFWTPNLNIEFYQATTQYLHHLAINNYVFCSSPQNLYQISIPETNQFVQNQKLMIENRQNQQPSIQTESICQDSNKKTKFNGKRIQNKGRNDFSNMLKVFFHQFKENKNIKEVIAKIVRKKKYDLNINQFLVKIKRKFIKGKTYVSPKQIIKYLNPNQKTTCNSQFEAIYIFKVLLSNFFKEQYFLCIMRNFKGEKQNRTNLIKKRRELFNILFKRVAEL